MKITGDFKSFVYVLASLAFLMLMTGAARCERYSGGTGEPNDPYRIATAEDLNDIGHHIEDFNKHFIMVNDINMAGYTYTTAIIAPDTDNTGWYFNGTPFTGTFDGNNRTIHNFTINTDGASNDYLGLFGQIHSNAIITNLRLENAKITGGTYYVGGLCGTNGDYDFDYTGGTISNCYFNGYVICENYSFAYGGLVGCNCCDGIINNCHISGSVNGDSFFGGLVGLNSSAVIKNCSADVNVIGGYSSHSVGGLVGCNENGTINNCHTNSDVTAGNSSYAIGGLVGENDVGDINNCFSTGFVDADYSVANLVGRNGAGNISNCYSAGTVIGKSYPIGGLVGYNYGGTIDGCYAADSVSGRDNSTHLGGLVGWNEGTITDCYAAGSVTGGVDSDRVGGLVGRNGRTITNCYASAAVSSGIGSSNLAGLCGYQWEQYYTEISNCFWDTESTGVSIGYNLDPTHPGTITNVFGKTTAEMQLQSTFTDYGWDFNTPIWKMCDGPDYPRLWWEECPTLEPAELIAELLEEVAELELPSGIENSLMAKLEVALEALEDENENNDAAAINTSGAFINAVEAQRGKKIPEAEADALIAAAQEIIELLSDE